MDRRAFLKSAPLALVAAEAAQTAGAADKYFPGKVDPALFEDVNRVKGPAISCPDTVKPGEPFRVEVSVGEKLHVMGERHWIEYVELHVGNEPAGRADFQPRGFLSPKVVFTMVLSAEQAPNGKVTLIAHQRCNLHGYWEGSRTVAVAA